MQVAVVFAALIHDVDHSVFTNGELIDMKATIASVYDGKCVAEQNSVNVAWTLLEDSHFDKLHERPYREHENFLQSCMAYAGRSCKVLVDTFFIRACLRNSAISNKDKTFGTHPHAQR
jgi:hypothetical protein